VNVPNPGLNGHGYQPAQGDDGMLARILMAESANTPKAMNDIGWAIVNRVGNPDFRPTLPGVINQPGQFDSVTNAKDGYWAKTDPANNPDKSFNEPDGNSWAQANATAKGILNGTIPDGTGGATYFFSSPEYNPQDNSHAPGNFPGMFARQQLSPVSAYDNNTGTNRTYIFRRVGN
jgi:spore germination cell wall hydrolase CwlJ-like protein